MSRYNFVKKENKKKKYSVGQNFKKVVRQLKLFRTNYMGANVQDNNFHT